MEDEEREEEDCPACKEIQRITWGLGRHPHLSISQRERLKEMKEKHSCSEE